MFIFKWLLDLILLRSGCRHCGQTFIMGETGTIKGCDRCTGVERDPAGRAWYPGEFEMVFARADGSDYYLSRAEAFKK